MNQQNIPYEAGVYNLHQRAATIKDDCDMRYALYVIL